MQEFLGAMVRFSTALTLFGLQQVRNAASVMMEAPMNLNRMREAMDSATNSLSAKIDDSQKTTLNSMTTLGADVVSRTCETLKNAVPNPNDVLRTTGEVLRRTTENVTSVLNRSAGADSDSKPAAASGEPQAAADVLAR
jgi:hypothetical protein